MASRARSRVSGADAPTRSRSFTGRALTNRYCWSAMPRLKVGRLITPVSRRPSRAQSIPIPWRSSSCSAAGQPAPAVRPAQRKIRRPSWSSAKPTSLRAIANLFTTSRQAAYSARGRRRNLRRAGPCRTGPRPGSAFPAGAPPAPHPRRAVIDLDSPAIGAPHPAFEGQPRHAGDRGQRLAAEAEAGDPLDGVARAVWRWRGARAPGAFRPGVIPQPSSADPISSSPPA